MNSRSIHTISFIFLLLSSLSLSANKGDNFLNKGNTQYLKGNLDDAMKLYSKADHSCIEEKDKIENNKALVYAQRGKLNLAIERLTNALALNPNNGIVYFNRGIINLQNNDYKPAIDDLKNAQFLGSGNDDAISYNLALSYFLDDQIDAAQEHLLVNASNDAKFNYLKGLIAYQKKDFDQAATAFKSAIASDNHPDIKLAYALSQYYGGNTFESLASLEKLKKEKSLTNKVNLLYAQFALEDQQPKQAKAAFEEIIKTDRNNAAANASLGNIALSASNIQEAKKYFNQAIAIQSNHKAALEGLATVEFLEGLYEKSVKTFDKLLLLDPTHQKALYGKALSAMHRPDPYTCLDALKQINKNNLTPEQIEKVVLLEARALGICNKKEEAIKLLKKYRSLALDKNKIKTLLAFYNLRMFRYSSAVSNIGIGKFTDYLPYLIAGHASLHRGQYSTAYRYYRKAYKLDNKNPDVLMGAAMCMIELDMPDQALRVIDSLEASHPENYYVYNAKGIVYKNLGLQYDKKGNKLKANKNLEISEHAFRRAKELRPIMSASFDNNIGLTHFYRDELDQARTLFDGSKRLASKNNRALMDISSGDYTAGAKRLDSLHKDFVRMNNRPNNKVKSNLELANKRAPMNNNYKFITYYFLHQDEPLIDQNNPFDSPLETIDLSHDLQAEVEYILEYSEAECPETEKKERKKKKKSKPKLKFLKKKKSTDCPTFKT